MFLLIVVVVKTTKQYIFNKIPSFYLEKQYNVWYLNTHESNQAFIKKKGGEACENQENRVESQFLLLSDQIDN